MPYNQITLRDVEDALREHTVHFHPEIDHKETEYELAKEVASLKNKLLYALELLSSYDLGGRPHEGYEKLLESMALDI